MRCVLIPLMLVIGFGSVPLHGADGPTNGLFQSGDRVVLIGNTLVEREQEYAGWELPLSLATADKNLIFRNLGWSGDTVWAESRGIFDPPAEGYKRTIELVRELKPTVIILGYGTVEAFAGSGGLPAFRQQYETLITDLSFTGARFAHLSPLLIEIEMLPEKSPKRIKQTEQYHAHVAEFSQAIRSIAEKRGEKFVDFIAFQRMDGSRPLTQNGIHPTRDGYDRTGCYLTQQLTGRKISAQSLVGEEMDELRQAIIDKNRLFFHRWRPQNVTYLFGFRKHEQGQNAVEIAQFDPFIAEAEQGILHRVQSLAGLVK